MFKCIGMVVLVCVCVCVGAEACVSVREKCGKDFEEGLQGPVTCR